jgi:serine/threonine protein kinase
VLGALLGNYRVVEQLGLGGMGEVWIGRHEKLGHHVVVKVLRPEMSRHREMVKRFFNEAQAATAIRNPGIAQVFDYGTTPDGRAFIVMELLEGVSLSTRLKDRQLDAVECCRLVRQMANVLQAAHDAGITHRDLKPDNLFLVPDPEVVGGERVKVLDFGIAKLTGELHALGVQTRADLVMGTPSYMSPEQCRGAGGVDARSDVYSLGCVLFKMVCGRAPFIGHGAGDIIGAQLHVPAPDLRTFAPEAPPSLAALVAKMLEKKPAARPPSMAAVSQALDEILQELGVRPARPSTPLPMPPVQRRASAPLPGLPPVSAPRNTTPPVGPVPTALASTVAQTPASSLAETIPVPRPAPPGDSGAATISVAPLAMTDPMAGAVTDPMAPGATEPMPGLTQPMTSNTTEPMPGAREPMPAMMPPRSAHPSAATMQVPMPVSATVPVPVPMPMPVPMLVSLQSAPSAETLPMPMPSPLLRRAMSAPLPQPMPAPQPQAMPAPPARPAPQARQAPMQMQMPAPMQIPMASPVPVAWRQAAPPPSNAQLSTTSTTLSSSAGMSSILSRARAKRLTLVFGGLVIIGVAAGIALAALTGDSSPAAKPNESGSPPPPPPVNQVVIDAAVSTAPSVTDAGGEPNAPAPSGGNTEAEPKAPTEQAPEGADASECKGFQVDKKWDELAKCADQLKATDPKLAEELKTRAVEEAKTAPRIAAVEEAIRAKDLKRAQAELGQVWTGSVDLAKIKRKYAQAETQAINELAAKLEYTLSPSCAEHGALLAKQRDAQPPRVATEAARQVPCTPVSPTRCDAKTLAEEGRQLYAAGKGVRALASYEASWICKKDDQTATRGFMIACNIPSLPKARWFWKRLPAASRPGLVSRCENNKIPQSKLDAP